MKDKNYCNDSYFSEMTVSEKRLDISTFISFIGPDRKVKWSQFRNRNSKFSYHENPEENICCKLMNFNQVSCEECLVNKTLLNQAVNEVEMLDANGSTWLITTYPVYDNKGSICGIFHTGNDITAGEKSAVQFRNKESEYSMIVENHTDLIVKIDIQGRFLFVNSSICELFGKRENELLGNAFLHLVHADDRLVASRTIELLKQPPHQCYKEHRALTKHGWRWIAWSESAVFDDKGEINAVIGVGRDIHEQKLAEDSLRESERRLSTLMSNLPGLAYRCKNDKNWTMEFVSQGCFELTGYLSADLIKNNKLAFNELIDREYQEGVWLEWQKAIVEKRSYTGEYQIITSDRKQKWVWEQGQAVYNRYGEVVALEGFIQDITDRKQTEIALINSKEKYINLIESALIGIYSTTINGELLIVNEALCRMLDYDSIEELLSVPNVICIYKDPADRTRMLEFITLNGKLTDFELTWLTRYGKEKVVLISAVLGNDSISGMVMDITQRKHSEQELLEQKLRAEQSDKLKAAFLANISHEIRTPLNGILGFTEILLEQDIAINDKEHYSNLIHHLSGQLLSIVNDILEISRIETNQIKLSCSQININQILNKLFVSFEKLAKEKKLVLTLSSVLDNDKETIIGDGLRLTQVLTHLLNNAIKFTYSGSISFGCKMNDEMLQFHVKDTGIGIIPENKEIIFERFRQVEDALTRKFGGSGLGLSISKALVEMMGGEIYVNSDSGKGSDFYFTIPYNLVTKKQKNQRNHLETKSCLSESKILICEDDDFGYLYVNRLLTQAGASTKRVISGNKAVQFCQSDEECDLIIMDLRMPEMSGNDAAEFIKKLRPSVPIIVCTASSIHDIEGLLNKSLFDDVVYKPIISSILLETICRLI